VLANVLLNINIRVVGLVIFEAVMPVRLAKRGLFLKWNRYAHSIYEIKIDLNHPFENNH